MDTCRELKSLPKLRKRHCGTTWLLRGYRGTCRGNGRSARLRRGAFRSNPPLGFERAHSTPFPSDFFRQEDVRGLLRQLPHGNLALNGFLPFVTTPNDEAVLPAIGSHDSERVRRHGQEVEEACPAGTKLTDLFQGDDKYAALDIEGVWFEDESFGRKVELPSNCFDTPLEVGKTFPHDGFTRHQGGSH